MSGSIGNLKILILAFAHFDNVISYAKYLGMYDSDVTLALILGKNHLLTGTIDKNIEWLEPGFYKDDETARKILPKAHLNFINNSINVQFIKTPAPPSLKNSLFKNYFFLKKIANDIKNDHYDIVHFNGTGIFCYFLTRFLRAIPKVWTLHDYKPHEGEGKWFSDFLNKKNVKKFDTHIQHYKYLQAEFSKYYHISTDKVFQIYSGTFNIFKQYPVGRKIIDGPYILFFGRLSPYKALEELVDAYKKLSEENNHNLPKLVIAGAGKLWFSSEKIKTNNSIIFLHKRIPTEDLISLIIHSIFIVAPYREATHSAVVTVSYTFKKPVLASSVGGLSEVILHKKTGFIAKSSSSEDLKSSIQEMLYCCDLESMAENIENLTTKGFLSWKKIAGEYLDVYKKTISFKENKKQ